MRPRHGARHHRPAPRRQTTTLHQFKTFPEFRQKSWCLQKIVAVIRIAHQYEPTARGSDPGHERIPVTLGGNVHSPYAEARSKFLAAVRAAVISHDDLSGDV